VALLALRVWVGQEFLLAGWTKLAGGWQVPQWFADLTFPWPQVLLDAQFNWVLAGVGELALGLAVLLGLCTRWAALGLLYVTFVAVAAVHFELGWAGWNQIETDAGQGFKVPLMLALMLWALLMQGGGRLSLSWVWPGGRHAR
jgi:putative oxidoreductase